MSLMLNSVKNATALHLPGRRTESTPKSRRHHVGAASASALEAPSHTPCNCPAPSHWKVQCVLPIEYVVGGKGHLKILHPGCPRNRSLTVGSRTPHWVPRSVLLRWCRRLH